MPLEYLTRGHVSEKTDTFAFGVVVLELLTGAKAVNRNTGELLSLAMYAILGESKKALEAVLDKRAGNTWSTADVKKAHALGTIARKCIEPMVSNRCRVTDVLKQIDELAGRKAKPDRGKKKLKR